MYRKIFLDTNPVVYLLEDTMPFAQIVDDFLTKESLGGAEFYTSTITDTEFLAKPYHSGDYGTIDAYWEFLKRMDILKCFVNEEIAVDAAKIRARYGGIKTADSIQLATSMNCGCDCFFTNDGQLRQVVGANVVYLGDM